MPKLSKESGSEGLLSLMRGSLREKLGPVVKDDR